MTTLTWRIKTLILCTGYAAGARDKWLKNQIVKISDNLKNELRN